jgi:peptidoglycan/xylan/chitin deacetylase (PgdA/CDA1 family)
MNRAKVALARAFDATGLNATLLRARAWASPRHVRALNYHDVPPSQAAAFAAQLRFYRERFVPVGHAQLGRLLAGEWPHERPGLILSFDDGLRSHADVCAPLLERHGFPGWFMVPVGFVDAPAAAQRAFADEHGIHASDEYGDGRLAMTVDDVRALDARGHVIGCHTDLHVRLSDALTDAELEREIARAKARLEQMLGHDADVFAWVGGEEWSYSRRAARAIGAAGFRFGFMTNHAVVVPGQDPLQLQRSHVEASFPPHLVRFHMSGFMDLVYAPKRRRVNRLTALAPRRR